MIGSGEIKIFALGLIIGIYIFLFSLSVEPVAGSEILGNGAKENELWAGSSSIKITPTEGMMDSENKGPLYLGGYGEARKANPDQIWDNLWARTLVLKVDEKEIAFVGVDSVGLLYNDCQEIKQLVRDRLTKENISLDHIIISSSHTHHAPDTMGLWGPQPSMDGPLEIVSLLGRLLWSELGGPSPLESGINPYYQDYIVDQTAQSIVKAAREMRPVGDIRFGEEKTSGLIRDTRKPVSMDENIYVMHVVDNENETISTLVKWACHPETALGFYDNAITPDYVHFLRETVENELGGDTVFINGAIGGLLTSLRVDVGYGKDKEASIPTMENIGKEAGQAALKAVANSEPGNVDEIEVVRRRVHLPLDNPNFYIAAVMGVLDREVFLQGESISRDPFPPELGGTQVEVLTEIMAIDLGKAQFLTVPGELYPEIAIGGFHPPENAHNPKNSTEPVLTEHMTGKYNFIMGLANDELGYIIPANDFVPLEQEFIFWESGKHRVSGKQLYGETNSLGPSTAPLLAQKSIEVLERLQDQVQKVSAEFTIPEGEKLRITGENLEALEENWEENTWISLEFEGGELLLSRDSVSFSDSLEFSAQKIYPEEMEPSRNYTLLENIWKFELKADGESIEQLDNNSKLYLRFDSEKRPNLKETGLFQFDSEEGGWEEVRKGVVESYTVGGEIESLGYFGILEKEISPPLIISPLIAIFFFVIILFSAGVVYLITKKHL